MGSYGKIAYETYAIHQKWADIQGNTLPVWADVRQDIKDAWEDAAYAVIDMVNREE